MKKLSSILLAGAMIFSLGACSQPAAPAQEETIETAAETTETTTETTESTTNIVTVTDANGNPIDVEFPANPEKVVVLSYQTLDYLDAIGKADIIVGMIKESDVPEHLRKYYEDETIVDVGGMKDPDMEAIMSLEPDIIFSNDRIEDMYDEFTLIAPTFSSYINYSEGFFEGYKTLAKKHGQILGTENAVDEIIAGYEERLTNIATFSEGKTALLGIFAGGLNTLGNTGRASIVVNEMGFENLAGDENVNHGNVSSYEAWLEFNPDYMFVLDKDTAVGKEAVAAKEQMEVNNPVIAQTEAFKNGNIVYLEPGATWYMADGGITSMDLMISCIEEGIGLK